MKPEYDLVALGGGTTGLVAALTVAEMGGSAALIEEDRPGGDCLYTGCMPSKTVLASAELAHRMRTADAVAIDPVDPHPDFAKVMKRVEAVIEQVGAKDSPEYLESKGIDVVAARGRFDGPGRIVAGERELTYRVALIATGSSPTIPPIPGLGDADPLTNETVFDLREQPERLAIIGGGPIGIELGQAFCRLGSEVHIFEALPRLCPREEADACELIEDILVGEGVHVHTRAEVLRVEPNGGGAGRVLLGADAASVPDAVDPDSDSRGPASESVPFDRVLVAAGRTASTDDLGLESVGVELTEDGAIKVNSRLKTTGSHIYAGGDVVGRLLFTHVAAYHGLVAVANGLFRARRKAEERWIPWVTFTDPEIARVGLTEAEARDALGKEPLVFRIERSGVDRAVAASQTAGFSKLVADRRGRLLGATLVGTSAGESIGELARLVRDRAKVAEVSQMVYAYPTFANAVQLAANEWWGFKYFTPKGRRRFQRALGFLRRVDRPR